jgi:DNA polymerase V
MSRQPIYALVDCNNFFVSCERVFRPDLWDKPVAVLSNNDGCIVARSNEVKALGVPMGVPLFQVEVKLKEHNVTLFSGNFPLYGDFSQRVVNILQSVCPRVEVYSVDESFLEISGLDITDYTQWARDLRQQIFIWTGIPVSIGVAPTKTLAKAAAEYAKKMPGTQGAYSLMVGEPAIFDRARHQQLLGWLPVGDIWGIGRRIAPKLKQYGISTAQHLVNVSDHWAQAQLSIRGLKTVKELRSEPCLGLAEEEPQQSIARTRMFGHRVRNYYELEAAIATFTAQAAAKLRQQEEVAGAILVFLRTASGYDKHYGVSTVMSVPQPSADTGELLARALEGLRRIYDPELSYKKGGVVLLGLTPKTAWQLSLLDGSPEKLDRQAELMETVDAINQRLGVGLMRHASEQPGRTTWRSKRERRSPSYMTNWQELPRVRAL